MVNGLPGKMASEVARQIISNENFELIPISFCGSNNKNLDFQIEGINIELVKTENRQNLIEKLTKDILIVDYTLPNAANTNANFYCENEFNFVMGTTGVNRGQLEEKIVNSNISAVVAPNMSKQIVAFQAMMEFCSKTFPKAFRKYTLEITESHQNGKIDTSGTAKSMIEYFNSLGILFNKNQIKMIRNPIEQISLGVPKEYINGHAWHTYKLISEDETVMFEFTHNINGRQTYGVGTIDALNFLKRKIELGEKGKIYSMIDVLKG